MRIPLLSLFITSPFDGLQEHAEKVKECAWTFQQAIECHISKKCKTFEEFRQDVIRMETEADAIKRRIRGHLPKGTLMPVDKFQLFRYLREQDRVLDAVEDALDWLSYRSEPGIPDKLQKDFFLLVDANIDPIEELSTMVSEARKYFKNFSEKQCMGVFLSILSSLTLFYQDNSTLHSPTALRWTVHCGYRILLFVLF